MSIKAEIINKQLRRQFPLPAPIIKDFIFFPSNSFVCYNKNQIQFDRKFGDFPCKNLHRLVLSGRSTASLCVLARHWSECRESSSGGSNLLIIKSIINIIIHYTYYVSLATYRFRAKREQNIRDGKIYKKILEEDAKFHKFVPIKNYCCAGALAGNVSCLQHRKYHSKLDVDV